VKKINHKQKKNRQGTEKKEIDNKRKTKLKAEKKQKFRAVPEHGKCRSLYNGKGLEFAQKGQEFAEQEETGICAR
jgi:hypothetical protein